MIIKTQTDGWLMVCFNHWCDYLLYSPSDNAVFNTETLCATSPKMETLFPKDAVYFLGDSEEDCRAKAIIALDGQAR